MKAHTDWKEFLQFFSTHNTGRRTRLGVFELKGDVVNDYWLEDGLPLAGVTLEAADGHNNIEVRVGDLTHDVKDAIKLTFHCTATGHEDGLDILARDNRTTILRFEK